MPCADSTTARAWRLPRWLAVCQWIIGLSAFHIVLPWAISLSAVRHGWPYGHPSTPNWIASLPVVAGFGTIAWALEEHFVQGSGGYEFSVTPYYLLQRGPYRFTRNPMYVAALLIWIGWTLFYGSVLLALAVAVIWIVLQFAVIPFEERRLAARFGEPYLNYKQRVARWLV